MYYCYVQVTTNAKSIWCASLSVNVWDDLVGHAGAVHFVGAAVLALAALVVALDAVQEQNRQVYGVGVGQDVREAAGEAPAVRHHQVAQVVAVAGQAPEARREEHAAQLVVSGALLPS